MTYKPKLHKSRPAELEFLIAELLRRMKFSDIRVLGGPGDKGIDIEALYKSPLGNLERVGVQVKAYTTRKVSVKEIKEFLFALTSLRIDKGIFITTSDFTRGVYEFIESMGLRSRIELINGVKLAELLEKYNITAEHLYYNTRYVRYKYAQNEGRSFSRNAKDQISMDDNILRKITLDRPILNEDEADPYTIINKIVRKIHGELDVKTENVKAIEITLHATPAYVVPWEVTYEGEDAIGRIRILKDKDISLVLSSGNICLRTNHRDYLSLLVRKVLRKKYGRVEATKVKCERGIGLLKAVMKVKREVASEYGTPIEAVRIKKIKECYAITKVELKARVLKGKVSIMYDLINDEILKFKARELRNREICRLLNDMITSKFNEHVIQCRIDKREHPRATVTVLTKSLRINASVNIFSGAIVDLKRELREDVAIKLAKRVLPGFTVVNYLRSGNYLRVLLARNHEACIVDVNLEKCDIVKKCGLIGPKEAFKIATRYIASKFNIRGPYHVRVTDKDLVNWNVRVESRDGIANIYVDLMSGKINECILNISMNMARRIVSSKYINMRIRNVKDLGGEYFFLLEDNTYFMKVRVSKSNAKITSEEKYIRPDILEKYAKEIIFKKFNVDIDDIDVLSTDAAENKWIIKLGDRRWRYILQLDRAGNVLSVDRILTKQGVLDIVDTFIIDSYKDGSGRSNVPTGSSMSHKKVEYLKMYKEKRLAKVRVKIGDSLIYYLMINLGSAEIVSSDILRLDSLKSNLKKVILDLKYR